MRGGEVYRTDELPCPWRTNLFVGTCNFHAELHKRLAVHREEIVEMEA